MIEVCSDGGIGIRTGLKILGPQGIEGSSPSPGTNIFFTLLQAEFFSFDKRYAIAYRLSKRLK